MPIKGAVDGFKVLSRPPCVVVWQTTSEMMIKTRELTESVELGFTGTRGGIPRIPATYPPRHVKPPTGCGGTGHPLFFGFHGTAYPLS